MGFKRLIELVTISACMAGVVVNGGAETLQPHTRQAVVAYNFSNHTQIHWENGRLLAVDLYHDSIVVHDDVGRMVLQLPVNLPGMSRVAVNDVTMSGSGAYAVAATAYSADGASAAFILYLDQGGALKKVVRTSPFAPMRIRFAPDGTLWAVGREYRLNDPRREDVPGHNVLRQFDTNGVLAKSLLPISSFDRYHNWFPPGFLSFLLTSPDRIGFYSGGAREWIEVSASGEIIGRWDGPPEGHAVSGAAMSDDGTVIISTSWQGKGKGDGGVFRLDKTTRSWIRLDTTNLSVPFVVGVEGDKLMVYENNHRLNWIPIDFRK